MDFSISELSALGQVILIDLVLAGDNAIAIGLAAAGVDPKVRNKVIAAGIAIAVVMRIGFAAITSELLGVPGIAFFGGVILAWVAWRFFADLAHLNKAADAPPHEATEANPTAPEVHKPLGAAILQITLADLSMSLDNVLAVAGAAVGHTWVLVAGLLLSIALMGVAAALLARLLHRYAWIGWVGLAVIVYVAIKLMVDGWDSMIAIFI
ncbi:MAG TPA: YjbE family putative metal transport protein [Micropepsaceae bacterium]|nr:YjbE family putative metal transport protein [Micropepsaceae bacterium]